MNVLHPAVYPISDHAIQYDQKVRGKWLILGVVVVVLAVGAGVISYLRLRDRAAASTSTQAQPGAAFNGPSVSLSGKVEATQIVTVPAPLDGKIESMPVSVGQEVFEGQLLAQIRSASLETNRDAASMDRRSRRRSPPPSRRR